ncbi:hypothetical protein [uncultured Methylobacterium sp.]|uniref:hypothetical protein n=1 Tax=uncultured Methylobacterium sp. TaxID=157278 RepID=UPI00258B075B|nr:hypothetical protein [uncultured Methylobacterium sp.]
MTTFTRQELEHFSDAAGRAVASADGCGVPVASRHATRFQQLMARRNRRGLMLSLETRVGGTMNNGASMIPLTALALPDR